MGSADLATGSVVGDWVIERRLGEGGMAVVYLARFQRLQRLDVLKVMQPSLAADPVFRRRFAAEAQLMCDWRHPHVVTVYDHREQGPLLYIAMQHVPHGDLRQVLAREGRLPLERALAVAAQVADALDDGHERGLVHRDVKPDNLLLDRWAPGRDHVLLSDFGISRPVTRDTRLTQAGELMLSPAYAAPEQWGGGTVDGRADQYALACTLYELVAGHPPFQAPTSMAYAKAHLVDPPPPLPPWLGPSRELDAVFARALAKRPEDRFAGCREFVAAALAAGRARTLPLPPAPTQDRAGGRRPWLLGGAAAGVAALVAVGVLAVAAGGDGGTTPASTAQSPLPTPGFQDSAPAGPTPGVTGTSTAPSDPAEVLAERFRVTHRECVPVTGSNPEIVASLRCQPVDPGVDLLTVTEWDSVSGLRAHIDGVIRSQGLREGSCEGGTPGWTQWQYTGEDEAVGRLVCYVDDRRRAVLQWTIDDDHVLLTAVRADGDLELAHGWWSS